MNAIPKDSSREPCIVDATRRIRTPKTLEVLRLGFEVRLVRTEEQLKRVCEVRAAAYARHLPDMAVFLREPENQDFAPGVVTFMAVRKLDGRAVGTARIQTNSSAPLEFETNIELPDDKFGGRLLAQGMRLAVDAGSESVVVTKLLLKSMYLYCRGLQVAHVIVAAEPPRDRFYRAFGFKDIFPGKHFLIESAPNHRCCMLHFDLERTEDYLQGNEANLSFLRSYCPDIHVFSSAVGSWLHPRRDQSAKGSLVPEITVSPT